MEKSKTWVFKENAKLNLCKILDLSKKSCWANCVSWSTGVGEFEDIWKGESCQESAEKNLTCYCGKFHRKH